MPGFGDTSLANLPEPRSVGELAAIALAVAQEAERRYAALARELRAFDAPAVVALLEELGGEHGFRAGRLAAKAASGVPWDVSQDPAPFLPRALSENGTAVCDLYGLTPYRVLAHAVGLSRQSFELYSYLAAAAEGDLRDYAEWLAGEELAHAARLRTRRRQAYHDARRQPLSEAYPAARLVESRSDLLAAALAIEERLDQRLAEVAEKQTGFAPLRRATRQGIEELRRAAEQAGGPGGPMAEELERFARAAPAGGGRAEPERATGPRRLLADCERAFTFYDAVASAPADEAVMLQAQDLSLAALERIRHVRADVPVEGDNP